MKDMKDAELAALARAGDRDAFGELVRRHTGPARRVARAILGDADEADDAAQDGFLAALKALDRFDPLRPFGPWLVRIVVNAAADRRRRRRVRTAQPIDDTMAAAGPTPDRVAERGELRRHLLAALAELPERQRIAIVLFDVEGYGHREIAEVLRVAEGTVRSDVFHARRTLRTVLAPWQPATERIG